jgi:hypothetical protein
MDAMEDLGYAQALQLWFGERHASLGSVDDQG